MTLDDLQQHGRERDSSTVDHEVHRNQGLVINLVPECQVLVEFFHVKV